MDKEFFGLLLWIFIVVAINIYQAQKKLKEKGQPKTLPKPREIPSLEQMEFPLSEPELEESWTDKEKEFPPADETESDQETATPYTQPLPAEIKEQIDEELERKTAELSTEEKIEQIRASREARIQAPEIAGPQPVKTRESLTQPWINEVRKGIVWSEILQPPVSQRRLLRRRGL